MINSKSVLAIIPARGGSKRLPRKNVLDLAGKPMIAWTIEAALNSKYIDRVVVSTDDSEIATISKHYGGDVPFIRPADLAKDTSTSMEVIIHAISKLEELKSHYEYIIFLQPTSPTRNVKHIDEAVELLLMKNADSIISVTAVNHPIEWTNILPDDHSMNGFFLPEYEVMRSQDFSKRYIINGAIYLNNSMIMKKTGSLINCGTGYAYIMKEEDSIDVDSHFELMMADTIIRHLS